MHARHRRGITVLAGSVADVGDECRHRIVYRADHVGDHDDRSRRQAGGGVGGQRALAELSKSAFIDAMHASLLVLAILFAVSAVVIALWAPSRDEEQLRPVRKLLARCHARAEK